MPKARIEFGSTRVVFLFSDIALKFPALDSWEHFLLGIVSNIREAHYYKWFKCDRLCPVLFCGLKGLILVMRRAEPLSMDEFLQLNPDEFVIANGTKIFVEDKLSSFGKIGTQIVAIDYGN